MQPGVVTGAVLELHAARAKGGRTPGVNSPLTTRFDDTSPFGNHGTLTTFAGTTSSGWAGTGTLVDPYRLVFDGTSDYVACPDLGACEDGVYSYESWFVYPAAADNYFVLVSEGMGTSEPTAHLVVRPAYGHIVADTWGVGFATRAYVEGPGFAEGTIHHAVMTSDDSYLRLYVDGHEVGTPGTPIAPFGTTATTVGRTYYSYLGTGAIIVARIYPFALTPAQVAQNYAAGYLWPANDPARDLTVPQLDDTLWQILAGSDADGWRDVTDEVGGLVYSTVMPGGPASASCTLPADVWGLGYNEVRADQKLIVRYAGRTPWSGIILPRGVNYQGE